MTIERQELLDCAAKSHRRIAELEAENKLLRAKVDIFLKTRGLEWTVQLEAENKALRERAEKAEASITALSDTLAEQCARADRAEASLKVYDDELSGAASGATMEFIRRLKKEKQEAEAELAQHVKNEQFLRQQADNWEAKCGKLEAACAEMRWLLENPLESLKDCSPAHYRVAEWHEKHRHALSSKCGQALLDRMRAMEELCDELIHYPMASHIGGCVRNCPACRWEALKEAKT